MKIFSWLVKNVLFSIVVSFVVGFFVWFFFNTVFNQTDLNIAEIAGKVYLPILAAICIFDLTYAFLKFFVAWFTAKRLGLSIQVVTKAFQLGLLKEKELIHWTREWVEKEVSIRSSANILAETLVKVRSKY